VHTLRSVVSPTTRTCVRGRCPRGWIQRGAGGVHTLRSVVSPTTRTCVRGRCPRAVAAPPSAFLRLNAYAWSTVTIVSNAPAAPVEQQVRAHGVGLCGLALLSRGEVSRGGLWARCNAPQPACSSPACVVAALCGNDSKARPVRYTVVHSTVEYSTGMASPGRIGWFEGSGLSTFRVSRPQVHSQSLRGAGANSERTCACLPSLPSPTATSLALAYTLLHRWDQFEPICSAPAAVVARQLAAAAAGDAKVPLSSASWSNANVVREPAAAASTAPTSTMCCSHAAASNGATPLHTVRTAGLSERRAAQHTALASLLPTTLLQRQGCG
jgi:hypothetical protein